MTDRVNLSELAKEIYGHLDLAPWGFWTAGSWMSKDERLLMHAYLSDRAWCDSVAAVAQLKGHTEAWDYVAVFLEEVTGECFVGLDGHRDTRNS